MEEAILDEVLAEVGRQRVTAKAVQQAAGVTSGSWGNYFVQRTRHVPLPVLLNVCLALDVLPEDLVRRARERAGAPEDDRIRELMAGLTPRQQREARKIRSAYAGQPFGQESGPQVKRG